MPEYLGDKEDTFDYNLYRTQGRRALGEQQRAALTAAGRATGGELAGLPGFAAGSVGPGYLGRLRRASLQRAAGQIGSDFSQLGAQQAGREQDFIGDMLRRRQEERYRIAAEKRNRPGFGQIAGSVLGGIVGGPIGSAVGSRIAGR